MKTSLILSQTARIVIESIRVLLLALTLACLTPTPVARIAPYVLTVGVVAAAGAWYRSPSALQAWLDWLAPKAAGILRGATHATLLVGLAAGALRLFNPVLLHTILTNLQATPVLTPIGEFALLLGGLNFFFGSYELPGWGQTRPW